MHRLSWVEIVVSRITLAFLLLVPGAVWAGESLKLYTYHAHPPFITGNGQGLTYALAERLNRDLASDGTHVEVVVLPRVRLNLVLKSWITGACPAENAECEDNWMVPWVNPKWGWGEKTESHYWWTSLMRDSNAIISNRGDPVNYQNPASLTGRRLGGIRGHRYVGIDELVNSGAIERDDVNDERTNLVRVLMGRIDVTLLPTSTVNYYLSQDMHLAERADQFFVAPIKHQHFRRFLMMPATRGELARKIRDLNLEPIFAAP